jgi:hypothetical protein
MTRGLLKSKTLCFVEHCHGMEGLYSARSAMTACRSIGLNNEYELTVKAGLPWSCALSSIAFQRLPGLLRRIARFLQPEFSGLHRSFVKAPKTSAK